MFAQSRISRVFQSAREIPFDNSSKIVLMSDCHRGDGSWADDFANNQNLYFAALSEYDKKKFTYIELGDGDELWENKRVCDSLALYGDVFALLARYYQNGRLYLLFGNHDMEKRNPDFVRRKFTRFDSKEKRTVPLFPGITVYEGLTLRHKETQQKIFLVHGHQADFLNGPLWRLSRLLVRYVWRPLELIGVNDPTSAAKNYRKKTQVEKHLTEWAARQEQILVTGHTHRPLFPEPGTTLYFNDGCCVHPRSVTALEIERGRISLVRWVNKIRNDGTIYVGREVLAGPEQLSDYSGTRSDAGHVAELSD